MERPNKTIRKSTKHNGSGKDTSNQTTRDREAPKNKRPFNFSAFYGSQSIAEILREMDSQIKKLGTSQEKQMNTLNKITSNIKSVNQNIEDIRENYL